MPALLIRQRVSDYDRWKRAFVDQAHARTANGCQGVRIFRIADAPLDVVILLEWDTLLRARLFAQSDDLLESLGPAVEGCPDILILDDTSAEP